MNLLIPITKELKGQASLILKGAGMSSLKPKFFNVDEAAIDEESAAYRNPGGPDSYDKLSWLFSLPVFDTVTLICPSDNANEPDKDKIMLEIALLEVTTPRNIVVTAVAGRNGTIKEYMSEGDADVVIKGSLTDIAGLPPAEQMKKLNTMVNYPKSLKVLSHFLSYLKITNLVVKDIKYSQQTGTRNVVNYEIKCISDTAIELKNA